MEYIDKLQSEAVPEPVIEIEETKVHPLLQAMRELKEEGIVESVDPNTIFNQVKKIHHTFQDIEEGDLPDRIYWFDEYKKTDLPLSQINLDEFGIDEQLVDEYAELIKASPNTMPPIVFDPIAGSIIDGAHRANAYAKLGYDTIPAYVGLTKSDSYGEREEVDEEIAYHGTTDDIAEFRPLTHFGTEKAAKDRMEYKKIKDGKIYKVDLNIKNPLKIKDFPGIHYDRLYAFELKDKRLISQEEMEDITFTQDPIELRKKLLAKLKELGIDGFVYKNRYEDKGNISYVIVDPRQVKVLSVEPAAEEVTEASPDTLEGSFTPDLVESKTWLAKMLAKGLKGKNAGTIYVLGSWYGNMGIFLQQAGVKFDKLVLVEPDEEKLLRSKDLLQQLGDEGKLILIHQNAEDVVYEKPGVVINTSCNETGPVFLTKLPGNMLCLLQARNNADDVLIDTNNLGEFKDLFPLKNVYYSGQKDLTDPETDYTRYMIIGLSGKKINSELNEDSGGNYLYHATSAGGLKSILQSGQVNAASGPQIVTRAQTKMPTVSMTRDWGYASGKTATQQMAGIGRDAILVFDRSRIENNFKTLGTSQSSDVRGLAYNPNFGGKEQNQSLQARAIAKKKYDYAQQSDPETKAAYTSPKAGGEFEEAVVVPKGALPIKGTLVGFYVNPASQLTKDASIMDNPLRLEKSGPNKFIAANQQVAETSSTGQGGGSAGVGGAQMVGGPTTYEQEYGMFKSKGPRRIMSMTEALDSSYPYEEYSAGKYHFVTDNGVKYKVYLQGKDMVEVAFSAILPGEEENFRPDKTTLTGTGDSRKVFGTVVKIVKEYLNTHKPNALYFTAENSEPSRVKLYNRLIAQVDKELPDYKALGNIDLGTGTAYMLRRKEKPVTEALDSSYPYEFKNNAYYFTTDAGTDYKVFFKGTDKVEVTFVAKGKHGQPKDNITGTGDSRKVFGTVIKIVKDYVSKNQPNILMFAADSSVPSRVRLYSTLASQASKELSGYTLANTLRNKMFTTFYLTKDNANVPKTDIAKNILHKTLDTVVGESTVTLNKLYGDNKPDRDETIWDYGTMIWDNEYPVETINPNKLNLYLQSQYRIEHYEELFDMMDEEQQEIVEKYVNDPNLSNSIIVLDNGYIVDGNHRALAAVIANKPIKYIDIGEENESS